MIAPGTGDGDGPFKVVVTHNGNFMEFEHLADANRYAGVLLNVHNMTTAIYSRRGMLVGSNETLLDGGPFSEDAA